MRTSGTIANKRVLAHGARITDDAANHTRDTVVQHNLEVPAVFFFQAEDGIRDVAVTGVQTCALPISIGMGREALDHWLAAKGHTPALPKGVEGIVAVRSMAQWALDYHADGRGLGFPFDLAWLDLSARCLHLLAALRTFLRTPPADAQVLKALKTLERMLRPLEKEIGRAHV